MMTIAERCILWNSQRYDQVYNSELAIKLLLEETEELMNAPTLVETLDAIGDIAFVAMGVFWKLGYNAEQINDIMHGQDFATMDMNEAYWRQNEIMWNAAEQTTDIEGAFPGIQLALYSLFVVALGVARAQGLQHRFYDICHAICDSNATKEVKGKTASDVKANVNKGAGFVPPTKALQDIIDFELKARLAG